MKSFKLYRVLDVPEHSDARKFAENTLPAFTSDGTEVSGWTGYRHLLDRKIEPDRIFHGGYLHLNLVRAEKKVNPKLLKAECTMEENVQLEVTGREFLSRKEKTEIRREVHARLLKEAAHVLASDELIVDAGTKLLFTTAKSETAADRLAVHWRFTVGTALCPWRFEDPCLEKPLTFTPEASSEEPDINPGADFLTWLWWWLEKEQSPNALTAWGVGDKQIKFSHTCSGAHNVVLSKGCPAKSAEATTCLLEGKKVMELPLLFADGEQTWEFSLDQALTFKGVRYPDVDGLDEVSRFQEKVGLMLHLAEAVDALCKVFVDTVITADWETTHVQRFQEWINARKKTN